MTKSKVITHGCRLNAFESGIIEKALLSENVKNTCVFNTCAVTEEAVRQARQSIRKIKRKDPDCRIIVSGCAAQISPNIFAEMPEVEKVIGNEEKLKPHSYLAKSDSKKIEVGDIFSNKPISPYPTSPNSTRTRAFLQVQQGCDHRCTFCIIPFGRGNSRSIPADFLVSEIQKLLERGHKEVVLTGVDISSYGLDLGIHDGLGKLVATLLKEFPAEGRLRLSSLDPAVNDRSLLSILNTDQRLMPHIHLSIQSGDNVILKRMKRRHSFSDIISLCEKLRKARPDIILGADLITGFPTETAEMFQNTIRVIEKADLTYLHVFPYSPRIGTPAAKMPQINYNTRKQRAKLLRKIGLHKQANFFSSLVGSFANIVCEPKGRGYTEHYAPVRFVEPAKPGEIKKVKIVDNKIDFVFVEPV
jgi:threonylcarbamoyladenosine tRNA methylthiotransferase MtaB